MIEWIGKTTDGKTIGTKIAKNPHDLFSKLDVIQNDNTDYFDRDLIVEFLEKKEPKLARLNKDIEQANANSDYDLEEKQFENQTNLIYETIDLLDDKDVLELIEFAGTAFINEIKFS